MNPFHSMPKFVVYHLGAVALLSCWLQLDYNKRLGLTLEKKDGNSFGWKLLVVYEVY